MGLCCARTIPELAEELVASPFFTLDPEDIDRLSGFFQIRTFEQGDILWDRGSESGFFGVVQSGEIEELFTVEEEQILITKDDGDSFGLATLLRIQEPSMGLVRAKTDATVYTIAHEQLWRFWRSTPRAQHAFFSNQIIPIHEFLREHVQVFGSMNEGNARLLSALFRWKFINAGEVLFQEDSLGNEFYIVAKGSCEVQVSVREQGDGQEPLIDQINRNNLLNAIGTKLSKGGSTPPASPNMMPSPTTPPSSKPTLMERLSKNAVHVNSINSINSDSEEAQGNHLANVEENVIQDSGDLLRQPSHIATLYQFGPGDCFGEVSLIIDMPRTGTILAKEDTILLELSRHDFQQFAKHDELSLEKLREVAYERMAESLRKYKIPIFSAVPLDKFPLLSRLSHVEHYNEGEVILNQGDQNRGLQIIVHGDVGVYTRKKKRKRNRRQKQSNELARLSFLSGNQEKDKEAEKIQTPPPANLNSADPALRSLGEDDVTAQIDPQLMSATESIQSNASAQSAPGNGDATEESTTEDGATHKKSNTGISDIVRMAEDYRRNSESTQSTIFDDPDAKEIEVSLLTPGCYFGESSLRGDEDAGGMERPSGGLRRAASKKLDADLSGIRITLEGGAREEEKLAESDETTGRPSDKSNAVATAMRLNREKTIENLARKGFKSSRLSRATFRCKTACVILRLDKHSLDEFFRQVPDAKTWFDIILSRYEVDLHSMLANPISAQYFTWFLEHEWAAENIKYYFAVEEYKSAWANRQPENQILEMARIIGNSFIDEDGDDQINVAGDERRTLKSAIANGNVTPGMFDETQYSIFTLLERDSFPRFKQSRFFQEFIQKVDNYNLVNQHDFEEQQDQMRRDSTVFSVLTDKMLNQRPAGSAKIGGPSFPGPPE